MTTCTQNYRTLTRLLSRLTKTDKPDEDEIKAQLETMNAHAEECSDCDTFMAEVKSLLDIAGI